MMTSRNQATRREPCFSAIKHMKVPSTRTAFHVRHYILASVIIAERIMFRSRFCRQISHTTDTEQQNIY
eukprot:scaffold282024_cov45-Attheya_sp.AAC.1